MMAFKRGVVPIGIQPAMVLAIMVAQSVFELYGDEELVITSICDGRHGAKSRHHIGLAVDIRTRHMTEQNVAHIVGELDDRLPGYDVVLEHDHIHIEYDP